MVPTHGIDESAEKTHPTGAELPPQTGFGAWPALAQVWSCSESVVMFGYGLGGSAFV
ncbi:hypothetical protein [Streptomyces sp. AcE210]|uniref:hypothetical protein n=1 Tax=Streptomyces sp. AcE210 TaxID=2292703 RepID=UPI001404C124|nr:hypothetical protein [Streptomyces sp. AcE210]